MHIVFTECGDGRAGPRWQKESFCRENRYGTSFNKIIDYMLAAKLRDRIKELKDEKKDN